MGMQPFFASAKVDKKQDKFKGGCFACGLHEFCKSPKFEAVGKGKKGILILTEQPAAEEDRSGKLLKNDAGRRLQLELKRINVDLHNDCWFLPVVQCRPNRTVKGKKVTEATDADIAFCRSRVKQFIDKNKPKAILCLGQNAIKSICQHRGFETGFPIMTNWEGELIPDRELQAHVIVTWNISYMMAMQQKNSIYLKRWREDVAKINVALKKKRPKPLVFEDQVEVVINTKQAAKRLHEIYEELLQQENPLIAFDYEGTGLKPYGDGHKLYTTAICYEQDKAIAFFMDENTWPIVRKFLRSKEIRKCAHNKKFEHIWTAIRGTADPDGKGFEVRNWWWDSMLGAFILDNRTGRAGLKFLTYVKLGVVGYDNAVNKYLKSGSKDTNAKNNIHDAPARELLLYNGVDTLATRHLSLMQHKAITKDKGLMQAYRLWHDGTLALADIEMRGIRTNVKYCEKQIQAITDEITNIEKQINSYPEIIACKQKYGAKFSLGSPQQMQWILYEHLGLEKKKLTNSGQGSTDKSVLSDLDVPFAKDKIKIAELKKIRDTYLKSFVRESPDGILHPSYNLHTVVSYRSSSQDPNFQNIPKRDPLAQKLTRSALYPFKGFCWLEVDYASIEVRIAATYHQDPTMLQYLTDPHSDMHRDMAMQIMGLEEDEVSKYLRNAAKNGTVFPFFYGDYYKQCAEGLWEKWFKPETAKTADGTHIYKHLKTRLGIKNLSQFTAHMREVENHFWGERFPVYAAWREQNWQDYLKNGYLRGHVGFIYRGAIMDKKQTSNYPTQGSGFHCLLRSLILLNKKLRKEQWKSFLHGQIHDAANGNAHPTEINKLLPMMKKIMVDDLVKKWTWINVPMDVEFELSPLNKSWYHMKQVIQRTKACKCGLEWGYSKKLDNGRLQWDCPVCGGVKMEGI